MKLRAAIVCALCAVSLYLRTGPFAAVFQPGFVNFSETDAWFHVRMADNLIRHFPWAITADPYISPGPLRPAAAGPLFDWVLALIAMIAGLGHPSEALLHTIAAWYPAILGMLIVPVVYLLGRDVFNARAGLFAAAVLATLPGHFLKVSSVGYTDHHVAESLLAALLLWTIVRARPLATGVVLGAYLLTFVGGAWLVALIVIWAAYELIRSKLELRPLLLAFGIALAIVAPFYRVYWMGYSIAALGIGLIALPILGWTSRHATRTMFFLGLIAAIVIAAVLAPRELRDVLFRLAPGFTGKTGAVVELQSLVYRDGHFSFLWAWRQFGGSLVLSLIGVVVLGELAVRRPDWRRDLIFFFGLATMAMAAGQLRMAYYFAIAAALFSGYVADAMLKTKPVLRPVIAATLIAGVLAPNVWYALDEETWQPAINSDWREALQWLRASTPEPFGDADYYYARYRAPYRDASYSVMSWWDFGYWITAVGRRVPVSNPTQLHAEDAAEFLLAQKEAEAAAILEKWHSRYVLISHQMVLEDSDSRVTGLFGAYFEYARDRPLEQYYLVAYQREPNGNLRPHLLYLPAYYRSMVVRLFVYGGAPVDRVSGAVLATLRDAKGEDGKPFLELMELRNVPPDEDAEAAESACKSDGCVLAGMNPLVSAVKLEKLTRFHQVFASSNPAAHLESGIERSIVQAYEYDSAPRRH